MSQAYKVPRHAKFFWAFGGLPSGLIDGTLNFFLTPYYVQCLGTATGGMAVCLLVSAVFDAVSDPLIGFFSDNMRSKRFGRRHGFMYSAIIPTVVCFFFLFHPRIADLGFNRSWPPKLSPPPICSDFSSLGPPPSDAPSCTAPLAACTDQCATSFEACVNAPGKNYTYCRSQLDEDMDILGAACEAGCAEVDAMSELNPDSCGYNCTESFELCMHSTGGTYSACRTRLDEGNLTGSCTPLCHDTPTMASQHPALCPAPPSPPDASGNSSGSSGRMLFEELFEDGGRRRHARRRLSECPEQQNNIQIASTFLYGDPNSSGLFKWLFFWLIAVKVSLTLFQVPHMAMVAELVSSYDERASIMGFYFLFRAAVGFCTAAAIGYHFFITDSEPGAGNWLFNIKGFEDYGTLVTIATAITMTISTVGTHSQIPYQNKLVQGAPPLRLNEIPRKYGALLTDQSFIALFFSQLLSQTAWGMYVGFLYILNLFIFKINSQQIAQFALWNYVPFFLAAFILSPLSMIYFGKKWATFTWGLLATTVLLNLSILLRLTDNFPENCTGAVFTSFTACTLVAHTCYISYSIGGATLNADLVESGEMRTGDRNEGVLFGFQNIVDKAGVGIGSALTSSVLQPIGCLTFPTPGIVSWDNPVYRPHLREMIHIYLAIRAVCDFLSLVLLLFYKIDRQQHAENVATAARRRQARAGGNSLSSQLGCMAAQMSQAAGLSSPKTQQPDFTGVEAHSPMPIARPQPLPQPQPTRTQNRPIASNQALIA